MSGRVRRRDDLSATVGSARFLGPRSPWREHGRDGGRPRTTELGVALKIVEVALPTATQLASEQGWGENPRL